MQELDLSVVSEDKEVSPNSDRVGFKIPLYPYKGYAAHFFLVKFHQPVLAVL